MVNISCRSRDGVSSKNRVFHISFDSAVSIVNDYLDRKVSIRLNRINGVVVKSKLVVMDLDKKTSKSFTVYGEDNFDVLINDFKNGLNEYLERSTEKR